MHAVLVKIPKLSIPACTASWPNLWDYGTVLRRMILRGWQVADRLRSWDATWRTPNSTYGLRSGIAAVQQFVNCRRWFLFAVLVILTCHRGRR